MHVCSRQSSATSFLTFSARFVREIHSTTGPTGQRHELLMEMCTFQDGKQIKGKAVHVRVL